ncbi:restriction endonuclease subunit S [Chryseobacterium limigenitum]|uniref:restriction endonuclease subunit S n=1 Tax=Chryseobacterium limigenitum TaxID=1612149 RepID=UPI0033944320
MTEKNKSIRNFPNLRFPGFDGEWKTIKLGDITSWSSGGTPSKENPLFWNGEIPWISASSMRGLVYSDSEIKITESGLQKGSRLAKKGSLLILVRGSMLFNKIPIGIVSRDLAFNQDVKSIIVNEQSSSEYILNWFSAFEPKILNMVTGTGIGAGKLDLADLKSLEVKIPILSEQKEISHFLSLINERITSSKKIIEVLRTLKIQTRNKLIIKIIKDDYEPLLIKDILTYEQPTKYIVTSTDYSSDKTLIPVLTANKAFILGYIDENFGIYDKGNCIILDDFTMDLKYVDFSFKVKSSAIKILTAKEGVNLKYIFEYFSFLNFSSSEHKRHYISEIEPMSVVLPPLEIQNKIANYLSKIDEKLKTESEIYDLFIQQKKYLLANLFV